MNYNPVGLSMPSEGCGGCLIDLKGRIHNALQRATLGGNREYALRDNARPIGVAEYQLVESLPAELQISLPSIEQIERELASDDASMDDESQ